MKSCLAVVGLAVYMTLVQGQEVTHHRAKQSGVLRVVSTLMPPYLVPYKSEEVAEETDGATDIPQNDTTTSSTFSNETLPDGVNMTTALPTEARPPPTFQGFIPDLLDVMFEYMELPNITSYEITLVNVSEGESPYTAMLNEVASGRADVAAAPMTVTLEKEKYVDFTYPFQRLEATIVMDKTYANKIKSLEDLVFQETDDDRDILQYGVLKEGAIHKFLQDSPDETHKAMVKYLSEDPVRLRATNNGGVRRARLGGYAFIIEESIASWVLGQKPCKLVGVKTGIFKRQYALAVPQRSELRDALNSALLYTRKDGKLTVLQDKWLTPNECASATWRMTPSLAGTILALLVASLN